MRKQKNCRKLYKYNPFITSYNATLLYTQAHNFYTNRLVRFHPTEILINRNHFECYEPETSNFILSEVLGCQLLMDNFIRKKKVIHIEISSTSQYHTCTHQYKERIFIRTECKKQLLFSPTMLQLM